MQPLRRRQANKAWEQRLREQVQRPRGQFVWGKETRILLLVDLDDTAALSDTQAFAKTQRNKGMEVAILRYTNTKFKAEELPEDTWTPAHMAFSGLPKPAFEDPWRRKSYDLVVHCGLQPFPPFDYLVAGLSAHQRVAAYDTELSAYDLMVTPPVNTGVKAFLEQVIHYLAILNPTYVSSS